MSTHRYSWVVIIVIKNVLIMNVMHTIFNLHDTKVVMCIILVLIKGADGIIHHLNITRKRETKVNHVIIVNTIFPHLYASYRILFNKVLVSSDKRSERYPETIL